MARQNPNHKTYNPLATLDREICYRAWRTKDHRFDGLFFLAVKTTGIYCRPICPVRHVKEENVTYYKTAIDAAEAGYRPCLRCRPDAAPGSPAWRGINATLDRALLLLKDGYLQTRSLEDLANALGITDRYLRKLFQEHIGVSPKSYALYQQCLFAKQLIQTTGLPMTQIAYASGFQSLRRFNGAFKQHIGLTPSEIRRKKRAVYDKQSITIHLPYRPPYNWASKQAFYSERAVEGLEWLGENTYGRTFQINESKGSFTATHNPNGSGFDVEISMNEMHHLKVVVDRIRRLLDLDAHSVEIDAVLQNVLGNTFPLKEGVRLPGVWNSFEAGIRAVLGQQISVKAAHNYCAKLVRELGEPLGGHVLFPTPQAIADSTLDFLRMPKAKKETLIRLSRYFIEHDNAFDPANWIDVKGIGPWTIHYAQIRAQGLPDIYMNGDLGVAKMQKQLPKNYAPEKAAPWRSYLTVQLWQHL